MSFGLEVKSEHSGVQVSSEYPSYVCIYSNIIGNRNLNLAGKLEDDVIVSVARDGQSGLASTLGISSASGIGSFGSNRVLVFRRRDKLKPVSDTFGIQVVDETGNTTFSSNGFLLLLPTSPVSNGTGIIWNGSGVRSVPISGTLTYRWLAMALVCDINGNTELRTLGAIAVGVQGRIQISFSTTPILVDISLIPEVYSTGDIAPL